MPIVDLKLPVFLPNALVPFLKRLQKRIHRIVHPQGINLLGDRDIEESWIASHMSSGPGWALDFGSGGSSLSLLAAFKGYEVMAIDLEEHEVPYCHPQILARAVDIFHTDLQPHQFDLIINCSAIEHVGLSGRYGVIDDRPDGDIEAMRLMKSAMKPGAIMLMTVPVGQDAVCRPFHRVYGTQRLPRLLEGFNVQAKQFWVKNSDNRWILSPENTALCFRCSSHSSIPSKNTYALGCFVLST